MRRDEIILFALGASRPLGDKVGRALGVPLAAHVEREFDDGERKCFPLSGVRGKHVFVLHALFRDDAHSPDEKLMRLLMFVGAAADAAAASVTAVVPYLCYARQDQKKEAQDPVTTRYVARMFEAVGTSRIVAVEVHNLAAFQNAFRLPAEHIETTSLFAAHFAALLAGRDAVVVAPDAGGAARAERLRRALADALGRRVASGLVEKRRSQAGIAGEAAFGDFAGRVAIVVDDLICTGATIVRAARVCRSAGAAAVFAAATHAAFAADAERTLEDASLDGIVLTDTIPFTVAEGRLPPARYVVLEVAPLLAASIREIHAANPRGG